MQVLKSSSKVTHRSIRYCFLYFMTRQWTFVFNLALHFSFVFQLSQLLKSHEAEAGNHCKAMILL